MSRAICCRSSWIVDRPTEDAADFLGDGSALVPASARQGDGKAFGAGVGHVAGASGFLPSFPVLGKMLQRFGQALWDVVLFHFPVALLVLWTSKGNRLWS